MNKRPAQSTLSLLVNGKVLRQELDETLLLGGLCLEIGKDQGLTISVVCQCMQFCILIQSLLLAIDLLHNERVQLICKQQDLAAYKNCFNYRGQIFSTDVFQVYSLESNFGMTAWFIIGEAYC